MGRERDADGPRLAPFHTTLRKRRTKAWNPDEIVADVVRTFLTSRDYNGPSLANYVGSGREEQTRDLVAKLVEGGRLTAAFGGWDINPHILRHSRPSNEVATAMRTGVGDIVCLYPTRQEMEVRREVMALADRPYTQLLATGMAQLDPVFFDLTALDRYLRDPRYHVDFHDYTGSLASSSAAERESLLPERDRVLIQTFGLAYRPNGVRVLAVPVRYLHDLTPAHQRYWQSYEIDEVCTVARAYLLEIEGEWPEHGSLYEAFLQEMSLINQMTHAMGKPSLFRVEYSEDRPREFGMFTLPTRRAYREFVLVLDQLLSENLNTKFFDGEVVVVDEQGKRQPSIHQLENWLRTRFRPKEGDPVADVIGPLRLVRNERRRPAHVYEADQFDLAFYDQQEQLLVKAYTALRTLRLMLTNHPAGKGVAVPDWLYEARFERF